jgi:hypothetical protein
MLLALNQPYRTIEVDSNLSSSQENRRIRLNHFCQCNGNSSRFLSDPPILSEFYESNVVGPLEGADGEDSASHDLILRPQLTSLPS